MTAKYSLVSRNNGLTQRNTDIGANAVAKLLSGTRPVSVDTALSGNTTLGTFAGPASTFGTVSAGVLTAGAMASVNAAASGTATFMRIYKSDGTTAVVDLDVGTDVVIAGGNVISAGQTLSISSITFTAFGA